MSAELYRAANAMFSGLRGALAMGTIGACAGFGAICGSSLATAATMTRVAVPEMRRYGYDEKIATGVGGLGRHPGRADPAVGGAGGLCHHCRAGRAATVRGGAVPGLICAALHIVVIAVIGVVQPHRLPTSKSMPWSERLWALAQCGRW